VDAYPCPYLSKVDVEKINAELVEFGNRCRKLPKALKEWDAYKELEKCIRDFGETTPLFESLANPAMLERHWKKLEDLTNFKFDIESEGFRLRDLAEAPLLQNKEEIEDICISAVKERDISEKLRTVMNEWDGHTLSFAPFKTRGDIMVNAGEVGELLTLAEDSLMVLGGLMSNR